MVPSDFLRYVSQEIHSVGSITTVIIPLSTMCWRAFSISSLASIGTFLYACCTGGIEGSRCMVYSSGMFPVVPKLAGKACFRVIMALTSVVVTWSWEGAMICTLWSEKGIQVAYGLVKGLLNGPEKDLLVTDGPEKDVL